MILSAVMEDYLKAIYHLQRETPERIRTSEIAEHLHVTPPTVTSMLEKLTDRGLLDREKHKGVRLTPEGEQIALEVVRHHRLLEAYLTEHLDYDWSEVHEEADRLEHHISEIFERRIVNALEDPTLDPHGDPIPSAELDPPDDGDATVLTEYGVGEQIRVSRISDRDPTILEYLSDHGIRPDTVLNVTEVAPFGMITVHPESRTNPVALPEKVAKNVRVTPE